MKLRLFCGGNCALRFKEDIIRAIGKTKPVAAIFVGATVQEYDGGRGLAGGAACSWYVDEDIVDINIFLARCFSTHSPCPSTHVVSLRTQVGENWPRKSVAQLAAFDLFENQDFKFRCSVTISRMLSKQQWWYTGCNSCHRVAKACRSSYADPHTYTYTNHCCPSTDATLMYCLSVIASDQIGEAKFTLFGSIAEQVTNSHIYQVIQRNQPTEEPIFNYETAAGQVRFPPPEISGILSCKYRFVVSVSEGSFQKKQPPFMVPTVEAAFSRFRRLSSADTVIPSTSWDVATFVLQPILPAQALSSSSSGTSTQEPVASI